MKKKCPKLTFVDAEKGLPQNLNFLEKAQVMSSMKQAEDAFVKQCELVRHESRQSMHKDLNCIKWPKPTYTKAGDLREIGEGKIKEHLSWLEEKTACIAWDSLRTLKSIYWLHIAQIITPSQPFRSKMDVLLGPLDWKEIDKAKVSIYSKQEAFMWRSSHGKLYANKDFVRMHIKSSAKCTYCEEEQQSTIHLYLECPRIQQLFACFEKQYKLEVKLSKAEKLIGIDPAVKRSKVVHKKLSILRREIYLHNHRDECLRWGQFLDFVDRVYTIEYGIADRRDRVQHHLKIWEK